MKRLFILIAAVMMAISMMAEGHMKFKGVEIDGAPQSFVQQLKVKGFTYLGKENGSEMLVGDFAGFKNCVIGVAAFNGKVAKVVVIVPDETSSWQYIYNNYSNLKEMLTTKYGKPSVDQEEWQGYGGKPKDDNSCMHELRMNRVNIVSVFEVQEGSVELTILNLHGIQGVMLTYSDAINFKEAYNNAIEDL